MEGSRRDWGDAGSGGASPNLIPAPHPESWSPGVLASLKVVRKLCRPLSHSQMRDRARAFGAATLSPSIRSGAHLDPAVISIFNPRAGDHLAVGFQHEVRQVPQKFLI